MHARLRKILMLLICLGKNLLIFITISSKKASISSGNILWVGHMHTLAWIVKFKVSKVWQVLISGLRNEMWHKVDTWHWTMQPSQRLKKVFVFIYLVLSLGGWIVICKAFRKDHAIYFKCPRVEIMPHEFSV